MASANFDCSSKNVPKIVLCNRVVRVYCDRLEIMFGGLVTPALLEQHISQIDVRPRKVWFVGQSCSKMGGGFVQPAFFEQSLAEIILRLRIAGSNLHRFNQKRQGFVRPSRIFKSAAQAKISDEVIFRHGK